MLAHCPGVEIIAEAEHAPGPQPVSMDDVLGEQGNPVHGHHPVLESLLSHTAPLPGARPQQVRRVFFRFLGAPSTKKRLRNAADSLSQEHMAVVFHKASSFNQDVREAHIEADPFTPAGQTSPVCSWSLPLGHSVDELRCHLSVLRPTGRLHVALADTDLQQEAVEKVLDRLLRVGACVVI